MSQGNVPDPAVHERINHIRVLSGYALTKSAAAERG